MTRQSDQPKAMRLRRELTAVVLLLGFVLGWACVFQESGGSHSLGTRVARNCSKFKCAKSCASPVCCAQSSQPSAPFAPAPPPSNSQNEWQALAATVALVLTLPARSEHGVPSASVG